MTSLEEVLFLVKMQQRVRINLIRLMREHGIGGSELARMLDVTPTDVSRWVAGKICPRIPTLDLICSITGWDPVEFFRIPGSEGKTPELTHAEIMKSAGNTIEALGFERPKLIKKRSRKSKL